MRLRLSVKRHALPLTNVLWSIPSSNTSQVYTISRLLEDVNQILPLESEHWGLEDYVVEVAGFECLHFSTLSETLKDDDQVLIRPLLTAEIRSRTLTGRHQISDGGQHLVDGIAYGRPYLRTPNRPEITIPPRKRPRLLDDTGEDDGETESVQLITANGEASHDRGTNGVLSASDRAPSNKRRRTVHFNVPPTSDQFHNVGLDEDEDEDDEDDDDFALDDEEEGSEAGTEDSSETDSDDSSTDSSDSSDASSTDSDTESSNSSEADSNSEEISSPEVITSKSKYKVSPPGRGTDRTRTRNQRRRECKRLKQLKSLGLLHHDATLQDYYKYIADVKNDTSTLPAKAVASTDVSTSTETMDSTHTAMETEQIDGFQTMKLVRAVDGTNDANHVTPRKRGHDSTPPSSTPDSAKKRLRPNVSAISRILSHQTRVRITLRPSRQVVGATNEDQPVKMPTKGEAVPAKEPEVPIDPNLWKSKINLSAFECWHEEYELSTPPFPFEQHWDPVSKTMANMDTKQKKRKKKKQVNGSSTASLVQEQDEETIILDYSDGPTSEEKDDQPVGTSSQSGESKTEKRLPDLPPLPDDVASLPVLKQADIKIGAIIVFKLFEMNPVNMNPEISSFKTAVVEEEGDSGNGAGQIGLRLAVRDLPQKVKKYNKKGERIYDRADNFRMESDEEEDGMEYRHFGELLEPHLLQEA